MITFPLLLTLYFMVLPLILEPWLRLEQTLLYGRLYISNQQSELQQKHQAEQVILIKKYEEESKRLAESIPNVMLRLVTHQQAEIESRRLGEMMDAKKYAELAKSFESLELVTGKNVKELEDRIKGMEKKNAEKQAEVDSLREDMKERAAYELEEAWKSSLKNVKEFEDRIKALEKKCADKQAEMDSFTEDIEGLMWTLQALTVKERAANYELEEAQKASLKAVHKYGNKQEIHVKKVGEIDDVPWRRECQQRYMNEKDRWELVYKTKLSEWEDKVKNPQFHAFKIVQVGNEDKWERKIDENNVDLLALREELGEEVMQTVVTALEEIEEYNASGRYPITIAWNFKENRRATLSEIIKVLIQAAESNGKKNPVVKKRRLPEGVMAHSAHGIIVRAAAI